MKIHNIFSILILFSVLIILLLFIKKDWFKIWFIRKIGQEIGKNNRSKLIASIIIDLIGMGSYLIPGVLEITDIPWAIISRELVIGMYGSTTLGNINLIEEIAPLTDILPTATIGYILENYQVF